MLELLGILESKGEINTLCRSRRGVQKDPSLRSSPIKCDRSTDLTSRTGQRSQRNKLTKRTELSVGKFHLHSLVHWLNVIGGPAGVSDWPVNYPRAAHTWNTRLTSLSTPSGRNGLSSCASHRQCRNSVGTAGLGAHGSQGGMNTSLLAVRLVQTPDNQGPDHPPRPIRPVPYSAHVKWRDRKRTHHPMVAYPRPLQSPGY